MVEAPAHDGGAVPRAVKVGVLLALDPGDLGAGLADAAAFDAAGVDALWIDDPGIGPELDVLALAAALAAITFRARLVVALPRSGAVTADLGRTLHTIDRLCHGRLVLLAGTVQREQRDQHDEPAVRASGVPVLRRVPGEPAAFEDTRAEAGLGRWIAVPPPDGRASWRAACGDAAERADGVVVPAGPRLLDILRNPADPEDRSDLHLAQG